MKTILFIFSLLIIFSSTSIHAQIKKSVYYSCDFSASELATTFMKTDANKNKNKVEVIEFTYKNDSWDKTNRDVYSEVSDSVFMNENLTFNKNTLPWQQNTPYKIIITKKGKDRYYFREYNYYDNLLKEGHCTSYFPLVKHGVVKEYYLNGNLSFLAKYENNRLISSEKWMTDGRESAGNVHAEVGKLPEFKGKPLGNFQSQLEFNIAIPMNTNRDKYINGICTVEFIVKKDGTLTDFQFTENSEFPAIDLQVYKFILKNKEGWSPAEICGKKVDYIMEVNYLFEDSRGDYTNSYSTFW